MIAEGLMMAMTIWYIPGWMRTETPQEGCLEAISNAFPKATVEFKSWNGDRIWPLAVESADYEVWRLSYELATMTKEQRESTILVGHSLGGRMTARILARLGEKDLKVGGAYLAAAAIPSTDPDLAKMGAGSLKPVVAIRNPDDITLRYIYATVGGEHAKAYGSHGSETNLAHVVDCLTPSNITEKVEIDRTWAKSQTLKDIANHHALFYLEYLKDVVK